MCACHIVSAAAHSQSHGAIKIFVKQVGNMIHSTCNHDAWSETTPLIQLAANSTVPRTTGEGAFYYMMAGRDSLLPIDTVLIEPRYEYMDHPTYAVSMASSLSKA